MKRAKTLMIPESRVRRLGYLLTGLFLCSTGLAAAAESNEAQPPVLVPPYAYRIAVEYDQNTMARIRDAIQKEIREALDEYQRRMDLSEDLLREKLKEAIRDVGKSEKFARLVEEIGKAGKREEAARQLGDRETEEYYRRLRLEKTREALELAEETRRVRDALLALSLEDWRTHKHEQRRIAEEALKRLDLLLQQTGTDSSAP